MSKTVEQRRRHFRIAKDGGPFAETQVRRDDDAGSLVEFAEQMEEQRSAGGAERQVAKLVEDDEIGIGKPPSDLPGLSLQLLLLEGVDQLDRREEPDAFSVMFDGLNADGGRQMRLARAGRDSVTMPGVRQARYGSSIRSIHWRGRWCRSSTASGSPARTIWPWSSPTARSP